MQLPSSTFIEEVLRNETILALLGRRLDPISALRPTKDIFDYSGAILPPDNVVFRLVWFLGRDLQYRNRVCIRSSIRYPSLVSSIESVQYREYSVSRVSSIEYRVSRVSVSRVSSIEPYQYRAVSSIESIRLQILFVPMLPGINSDYSEAWNFLKVVSSRRNRPLLNCGTIDFNSFVRFSSSEFPVFLSNTFR